MSTTSAAAPLPDLEAARQQMIEQQLRTWDVLDLRVLDAIATVRREDFVPPEFRKVAFADTEIPLGHGQRMLAPKVEGKILQTLAIEPIHEVLDIGTGSGFLAACMGRLGARVRSVEIFADLAERARRNVFTAAVNNVVVETLDATTLRDEDRYDAIAITSSLPPGNDELELRFARALRIGGRMFLVKGAAPVMQAVKVTRVTASHWRHENLFETVVDPLENAVRPTRFVF